MESMVDLRKQIWKGVVLIQLHVVDLGDLVTKDLFLQVRRCSYLPCYYESWLETLRPFLRQADRESLKIEDLWISDSETGEPLKWHYPIGLLADMSSLVHQKKHAGKPWKIQLHTRDFPHDKLFQMGCGLATSRPLEDVFMAMIKESDFIRHGSVKRVFGLAKQDQLNLWKSILEDDFDTYWKVNALLVDHDEQPKCLPLRIYLPESSLVLQRKVPLFRENLEPKTLKEVLEDFFLFQKEELKELLECTAEKETVWVMHGIQVPLEVDILDLVKALCYPDNFLHLDMLQIQEHAYKGRCYMTREPVKAGSLLLTAPAYAAIPDAESKRRMCAGCLQWCEPPSRSGGSAGQVDHPETPEDDRESQLKPPMFLHHTCFSTYSNVEAIPGSRSVSMNELFFQRTPAKSSSRAHDNVKTCRVGPPCHQVFYCSMECSERDWLEYHVFECSFFREFFQGIPAPLPSNSEPKDAVRNQENFDNYTLDFMWLLMRVLIRRAKSLSSMQSPLQPHPRPVESIPFDKVWALCDNIQAFPQESISLYKRIAKQLLNFVKDHLLIGFSDVDIKDLLPSVPDESQYFQNDPDQHILTSLLYLVCKEECNSFGLYTFRYKGPAFPRQGYGLAVFPDAVYFNHACTPNVGHVVRRSSRGTDLLFYSLRDLKEGEEALISYLDLELTPSSDDKASQKATLERRSSLKGYFFFDCDCQRCAEELGGKKDTELVQHLKNQLCSVSGCRGRILPWFFPSSSSSLKEDNKTAGSGNRKDSATVIHEDMRFWRCEACGSEKK